MHRKCSLACIFKTCLPSPLIIMASHYTPVKQWDMFIRGNYIEAGEGKCNKRIDAYVMQ